MQAKLQIPMKSENGFMLSQSLKSFCEKHRLPLYFFYQGLLNISRGRALPEPHQYKYWKDYVELLENETLVTLSELRKHYNLPEPVAA